MSEESKMLPKSEEATPTLRGIAPCIRSRSESTSSKRGPRKVSFPDEETALVTGYLEPANPWEYEHVTREDLIMMYKASCVKHGTAPLPQVVDQLKTVDPDAIRNETLNLKGEQLGSSHCETLEEVLKRVQFKNINLEGTCLDDEGSVALFDMMEYYESATHLNISSNKNIGARGWQACSRMIKKTTCLEQLEARSVTLNEQFMPILSRALRVGTTQLQVLKLENCNLSGRPIIILAAALKLNTSLRELYLADNNLGMTDAIQLGGLLRSNFTLQLLDVSNNNIQDAGLGHISDGLIEQKPGQAGSGLGILVLWNNHLTRNASTHFSRAVARSQTLETLNMGQNVLTNEIMHVMKDSLQQNRNLLRLGMQSTHLTCEGAIALAECIADNPVIQRIDLRENNLKVAGLMALALSMKVNTSVTQLDLDSEPKKKDDAENSLEQYRNLVTEIRGYCSRNEASAREEEDTLEDSPATGSPVRNRIVSTTSRKISLTCETLLRNTNNSSQQNNVPESGLLTEPRRSTGRLRSPAPSPIPSPVSSPVPSPSRTRFQVSRVAEANSPFLSTGQSGSPTSTSSSPITPPSLSSSPSRFFPSPSTSRFRVTLVEPSSQPPAVTSPSGNVTVGFQCKQNSVDSRNSQNSSATAPQTQVTKSSESFSAPEIVVTSTPQHTTMSQSVKVTVKLEPSSDNLIIENDPSSSIDFDLDDSTDMEVSDIMGLVSNNVQDSVTLLRRSGRVSPSPVKDLLAKYAKSANEGASEASAVKHDSAPKPENDQKLGGMIENNAKQTENTKPAPVVQRNRKISWIAPANSEESKSSLEKLLGLFNPGSFFNKTHQQYKDTAAARNHRPVTNSNASFVLAGSGSNGISQAKAQSEAEQCKQVTYELSAEAKVLPKQSPEVLKKDRQISNNETPIPDIVNNNNKVQEVTEPGASVRFRSERVGADENKHISRQCEDENYNVPRNYDDVCESNAQAVRDGSFEPSGKTEGLRPSSATNCDSKCNISSKQVFEGCATVEAISAEIESVKLSDKAQCDIASDRSWSQSCEPSYAHAAAATVRLVGGASGFDTDKDEAREFLPELCAELPAKQDTLPPSNTV